jgi:hypothetical protein
MFAASDKTGNKLELPFPLRGRTFVIQASQDAGKLTILLFRGALRAEDSIFSSIQINERFLASLGMTK